MGATLRLAYFACRALALHFMAYNFVRVHQTLKTTPAVAAGIARRPWRIEDVVALLDPKS